MALTPPSDASTPFEFDTGDQHARPSRNSKSYGMFSAFMFGMMVATIGLLTVQRYGLGDASFMKFFYAPPVQKSYFNPRTVPTAPGVSGAVQTMPVGSTAPQPTAPLNWQTSVGSHEPRAPGVQSVEGENLHQALRFGRSQIQTMRSPLAEAQVPRQTTPTDAAFAGSDPWWIFGIDLVKIAIIIRSSLAVGIVLTAAFGIWKSLLPVGIGNTRLSQQQVSGSNTWSRSNIPMMSDELPTGVASPAVQQLSSRLWSWGWLSWWSQIILSVISSILLLFANSISPTGFNLPMFFGRVLAVGGVFFGWCSCLWTWRYTRQARKNTKQGLAAKVAASNAANSLRKGLLLNICGMGLALLGAEAIIGSLAAKAVTQNVASQLIAANQIQALDVFVVQANTNTILLHFCSLCATIRLQRAATACEGSAGEAAVA